LKKCGTRNPWVPWPDQKCGTRNPWVPWPDQKCGTRNPWVPWPDQKCGTRNPEPCSGQSERVRGTEAGFAATTSSTRSPSPRGYALRNQQMINAAISRWGCSRYTEADILSTHTQRHTHGAGTPRRADLAPPGEACAQSEDSPRSCALADLFVSASRRVW
jgi:hypothetical protein